MRILRPLARFWTILLTLAALTLGLGLVARWLLPLAPWNEAATIAVSSPVDGAVDVLPRSVIAINFSTPMNRAATLASVQIAPATPGSFRWSDDARRLTFTPAPSLTPDASYTVTMGAGALGQWWRPVAAPRQIRFRTAPLPAVIAALPDSAGVPIDGSMAIIFSQAIVAADRLGPAASLRQLHIEPPVSVQLRWLDQTTLLIRPDAPLRAATRYTATIAPDLTDLHGVDLGRPFSWSWSTAWPEPLAQTPEPGARWVSPRQPLVLTLAAPVDEALLRSSLTIEPPVEGAIETAAVGATQVITFTPRLGWQYGRSYRVQLSPASDPAIGPPPDLAWRFSVEPEPALIAFFPGQGQVLVAGQDVRLIFSTPMDEAALRAGLRIEPLVGDLGLQVSETEVRLRPELRPSASYTITVAADTRDRSGEPLGVTATVRLRAASAEPALRAPAATANVLSLAASSAAQVELERINLSRLDLSLYRLDTPTAVRAIGLAAGEWPAFSPERYGQSLARSWQLPLSDPADTPVRASIPIGLADGSPLGEGIYYLRILSREGPRADLLLVASPLALTMRQSDSQVLIWATDSASGAPVAGAPLLLYAGEALIARGQTGGDGVWTQPIQRPAGGAPYLALADGPRPALVRGDWLAAPTRPATPRYRSLPLLDRLAYQPGDRAQIGGLVRRVAGDASLGLPAPGALCRMQLEPLLAVAAPSPQAGCQVSGSGEVSGTLSLSPRQPPGDYRLLVRIGDSATALDLKVAGAEPPLGLTLAQARGGQVQATAARAGLPLAGAAISWTIDLQPLTASVDLEGFHFAQTPPPERILGAGVTDADGRLIVALPPGETLGGPVSYRLLAELRVADATPVSARVEGAIRPRGAQVGLRLPARVVLSDERAAVELLVRLGDGGPARGVPVGVRVYRRGDSGGPPLLVRSAVSDAQGRAAVQLVQLGPGAYEIVAATGDSQSSVGLWVAGPRYTAWANDAGAVALVPDRDRYRPGDVARLLVTTPYTQANLLLTADRGDLRRAEVDALRPGQLITLTITPDMAPAVSLGAVVASGGERLVGAAAIAVDDGQPALGVDVASDRRQYDPGATAVVSVTSTLGGAPAPADLLLSVAPADAPWRELALAAFAPQAPPPPETALLRPGLPEAPAAVRLAAATQGVPGYLVRAAAGAGSAGQAVLHVPLPDRAGAWAIRAYATAGAAQFALASTVVTTSAPLDLTPDAPAALRPGDQASASLLVRNTGTVTRELQVRLQAAGGEIAAATPAERRLLLAPGGSQRLLWSVGPRPGVRVVNLRYTVSGDTLSQQLARDLPVAAAAPAATHAATLVEAGSLATPLPLPGAVGDIDLALAPGVWATLADSASGLAALPQRGVEERAGMLMISAALARATSADAGAPWAAMARQAADELAAAQNADGGWGWWPGQPSRPYVSAFAVEAQAFARDALPDGPRPLRRAIDYLARAGVGLDADTQAYLLYVRARAGAADLAAARALAGGELGPDGLAYLALTLPQDALPALLDRLIALAERQVPGDARESIAWPAGAPAAMPRGQAALTAAAAQALRAARPQAAEVAAAERGLLMAWGVDGWPGTFTAARVAAALRNQTPQPGGPRTVQLGGAVLLDRDSSITATVRLRVPAPVAAGTALRVVAAGPAAYLVAVRGAGEQAPVPGSPASISLHQEYVDPASGAPLDPGALRVGQIVALRLTAVIARPVLRADLEVALPAALQPLDPELRPPFVHVAPRDAASPGLRVEAADLRPGVYTLRVLARVASAGRFGAPGSRLLLPDEGLPPVVSPDGPALTVADETGGN